jgi:cobalt transporter subunit CbtB
MGIKMQIEAIKTAEGNAVAALTLSSAVPIFAAALLGMFIVGGVGFSHIEAVHNAAHDYRHSMSFPCH